MRTARHTAPSDVLAPNGDRPSADTMLIEELDVFTSKFLRAPSQYKDRLIYVWRFPC